jgi:hypothetical protein
MVLYMRTQKELRPARLRWGRRHEAPLRPLPRGVGGWCCLAARTLPRALPVLSQQAVAFSVVPCHALSQPALACFAAGWLRRSASATLLSWKYLAADRCSWLSL